MPCLLVASIITCWISMTMGQDEITIKTPLGKITGIQRTVEGSNVFEFRKIPFAKPPVGQLRFEKPIRVGPWETTLDATSFGPSCYQAEYLLRDGLQNNNISEDCLFLNMYVPFNISSVHKKSVMVWIHGGSYRMGQGTYFDGSQLAITGNVIVVTMNYRLNVFGFLCIDGVKCNFGLWDQIMSIQWVKDNIASFGGNSQSITIFGESAGGFSVGLLSIAPINRGLFQRVILQSGVATSYYAIGKTTKVASGRVADYLNCTETDDVIQCLKDRNADDVYSAFTMIQPSRFLSTIPFAPVIDGELLQADPLELLQDYQSEASKFYRSLDVTIGTVTGESSLLLLILESLATKFNINITQGIPKKILSNYLVPEISSICCEKNVAIPTAISDMYGQSSNARDQTDDVLNLYSDYMFDIPAIQSLQLHSSYIRGRQFHYVFSRESPSPLFGELPSWFSRSEHGAEVIFLFPVNTMNLSSTNLELSMNLMKYWTYFAKTGDVNGPGLVQWNEYDKKDRYYINLDANISTGRHLYEDRVKFWLKDVKAIVTASAGHSIIQEQTLKPWLIIICICKIIGSQFISI